MRSSSVSSNNVATINTASLLPLSVTYQAWCLFASRTAFSLWEEKNPFIATVMFVRENRNSPRMLCCYIYAVACLWVMCPTNNIATKEYLAVGKKNCNLVEDFPWWYWDIAYTAAQSERDSPRHGHRPYVGHGVLVVLIWNRSASAYNVETNIFPTFSPHAAHMADVKMWRRNTTGGEITTEAKRKKYSESLEEMRESWVWRTTVEP